MDALARAAFAVRATREPGGSPGAEELRKLFVGGEPGRWDALSEALLVTAARRDHLVRTIWPALERGEWVISDRFADSTMAYQGYAGGVPRETLEALYRLAAGEFRPDLTIILDLPVELGLARAVARGGGEDRFEKMGREFHERLRAGYLDIAGREPERCVVVDASQPPADVHAQVLKAVLDRVQH